jgi:hypothetical protein
MLFDDQPIPLRKQHQGPQTVGMIASTADVGVEHLSDGGEIEKFLHPVRPIHQKFSREPS